MGWSDGCLVDRLDGWLVDLLGAFVGWFVGWLASWLQQANLQQRLLHHPLSYPSATALLLLPYPSPTPLLALPSPLPPTPLPPDPRGSIHLLGLDNNNLWSEIPAFMLEAVSQKRGCRCSHKIHIL